MSALSEHYAGKECSGDTPLKSTQAMRDRVRELMSHEQDDYDRAVECVLDDLERLLSEIKRAAASTTDPVVKGHLSELVGVSST